MNSGVGPFYDGVAHFFITPEDILIVFCLALFGGLSGKQASRGLVLVLPLAWFIGSAVGRFSDFPALPVFLSGLGILVTGILVATAPAVPTWLPGTLAGVLGFLHGLMNGNALTQSSTLFLAAVGIVSSLVVVALITCAVTATLTQNWQRITARVLGSWGAAIGLLSLAWSLRPEGP